MNASRRPTATMTRNATGLASPAGAGDAAGVALGWSVGTTGPTEGSGGRVGLGVGVTAPVSVSVPVRVAQSNVALTVTGAPEPSDWIGPSRTIGAWTPTPPSSVRNHGLPTGIDVDACISGWSGISFA